MRAILADAGFRRLLIGQTLSMFGSSALLLVLAIWVKELTGSNAAAGIVFMLLALPSVATPLMGVLVDRYPRRHVMIAADLVMVVMLLPLLLVNDRGDVWIVYAVTVVYAIAQPVFGAAKSGLLTSMLDEEHLAAANGALESTRQSLRIAAPLAGAGLYALWGGGAVAILDAATFAASAVFLLSMRVPDLARSTDPLRFLANLTGGALHIWRTHELRVLVGAVVFCGCVIGLLEGAAFLALMDLLGKPPAYVGVVVTVQGVGSIVGGIAAGAIIARVGELRTSAAGIALIGVGFGLCVLANVPAVWFGATLIGLGLTPFVVAFNTLVQKRTPLALQGRVFTAIEALWATPFAIAIGLGALLVSLVDVRYLYAVNAVWLAAIGVALFCWRAREPVPETAADAAV